MMISVIVRMGFFARFNLIQRCSRPLPAVGQNGFSGVNGHLGAATVFAPQGRGAHQQHTGQRGASRLSAANTSVLGLCKSSVIIFI